MNEKFTPEKQEKVDAIYQAIEGMVDLDIYIKPYITDVYGDMVLVICPYARHHGYYSLNYKIEDDTTVEDVKNFVERFVEAVKRDCPIAEPIWRKVEKEEKAQ